jgi:hypothetical protein
MVPHDPLLVSFAHKIGARTRSAQQHEAGIAICLKVGGRCGLIDIALDQPGGTRKAATLVTDGRQLEPEAGCGVPDELVLPAVDIMSAAG